MRAHLLVLSIVCVLCMLWAAPAHADHPEDLSVKVADTADPVAPGARITYNITVSRNGEHNWAGARMELVMPPGTGFVSLDVPGENWNEETVPEQGGNGLVSAWNSNGAGLADVLTLVVTAPTTPVDLSATATVEFMSPIGGDDPTPANNTDTETTAVRAPSADLRTTIGATPARPLVNGTIAYSVGVTNTGSRTASAFAVRLPVPAWTRFVSATQLSGPALGCARPAVGRVGTVSCTRASLLPGAAVRMRIVVRVAPAGFNRYAVARATAATSSAQSSTANDVASVTRKLFGADLRSVALVPPVTVAPGRTVVLRWRVSSIGTAPATGATLVVPMPSGMTASAATVTGGTCVRGTTVRCTMGTLAPGTARVVNVSVRRSTKGIVVVRGIARTTRYDVRPGNSAAGIRFEVR